MTTSQSMHGGETPSGRKFCSRCLASLMLDGCQLALGAGDLALALEFSEAAVALSRASLADGHVCKQHADALRGTTGGGRQ